jgi:hypothetical protein
MAYPMESILEDISAEVANINVPTVLLAGELDQVDSIERHKTEVLAYMPNAEFKIIKGSGHLIPIDEPRELAKEIASFMGGLLLSGIMHDKGRRHLKEQWKKHSSRRPVVQHSHQGAATLAVPAWPWARQRRIPTTENTNVAIRAILIPIPIPLRFVRDNCKRRLQSPERAADNYRANRLRFTGNQGESRIAFFRPYRLDVKG